MPHEVLDDHEGDAPAVQLRAERPVQGVRGHLEAQEARHLAREEARVVVLLEQPPIPVEDVFEGHLVPGAEPQVEAPHWEVLLEDVDRARLVPLALPDDYPPPVLLAVVVHAALVYPDVAHEAVADLLGAESVGNARPGDDAQVGIVEL